MECFFCHPPPEECTDEAVICLLEIASLAIGHSLGRSLWICGEGSGILCPSLWLLEPHFDGRVVPAWLSAQIPAEIGGSSASSLCMPGNINFCHGVWALLH